MIKISQEEIGRFAALYKQLNELGEKLAPNAYHTGKWTPDYKGLEIDEDGITFKYEYNDACGCHPEYTTSELMYSWEQLANPDLITLALKQVEEKKTKQQEAQKQREEQMRAELERRDRAILEDLKKKYDEK